MGEFVVDVMTMYKIESLAETGMRQVDIAEELDLSLTTVNRVLNGRVGSKQREIADRMESLLRGSVNNSGCYRALEGGQQTLMAMEDSVFDQVAFEEALEQRLGEN